ncbi:MAG: NADP-dependent malic enzyme [Candidatus Zixiibacteriota bacterium]
MVIKKEDALDYHSSGRKGKIEVIPSKPCLTQRDLSMAYTPGVAQPCLEIAANPDLVYEYTAKGNLVAVISNGTAVLGLGDIGPEAGKPVMEGKGVLFKRFADVDVFDIEIDGKDPKEIINFCRMIAPTFGGINLEDIKAPECFEIEETLIEELDIPVFHDDQHGTAIISGAALVNALELVKKDIDKVKCVFLGAGAAGVACANLYLALGVKAENVRMVDSKGVIYKGRTAGMNKYKEQFAVETDERTLEDVMKGADVFVGVSAKDMVTQDMVRSMADNPIIFAMANPDPEISYEDAKAARPDVIIATGRSDYPNQVNNVLGFPFIFRGALDVHARKINMEMKLAASKALAQLAKEHVPESVSKAYGGEILKFGPEYIIPKPFDPRILIWESAAVAKAAMDTGVARRTIDIEQYKVQLENRLGKTREVMRQTIARAKSNPKRVVYTEGGHEKIIEAARRVADEGIAIPILIGNPEVIQANAKELELSVKGIEIIDPRKSPKFEQYAQRYFELRCRRGVNLGDKYKAVADPNVFGTLMVEYGDADCLVSGVSQHYPDVIRPALQLLKSGNGYSTVCGVYVLIIKNRTFFFADTTVNINPTADELVEIALMTAATARHFNVTPRVAMLSFSNFGSVRCEETEKVVQATEILKREHPELIVEGEIQADTAVAPYISDRDFPFSAIKGDANCLIFPNLDAGTSAYKLVMQLGNAEAIGPILQGIRKPVHVLHRAVDVDGIVNMTALAAVDSMYPHPD